MANYYYKGYDLTQNEVSGTIEAKNLEEAKKTLSGKSIVYTNINRKLNLRTLGKNKLSDEVLSAILKDLSTYTASGITISNALKLCAVQYRKNDTIKAYLDRIIQRLEEGVSFYRSLEADSIIKLPQYVLQTIKMAEEGAFLQRAFASLHTAIFQKIIFAAEIKKALAYPSFIVFASVILLGVMFTVAVPVMVETFAKTSCELPTITKIVIAISDFVGKYQYPLIAFMILAPIGAITLVKTNEKVALALAKTQISLWPIKGFFIRSELSKFLFVVSMLANAGVTMSRAFRLSIDAIDNIYLKKLFLKVSDSISEGTPLSKALLKYAPMDEALIQTIYLGEESGSLAATMLTLSEMYAEQNKRKVTMFITLLEPMLMLVVGSFVGIVLIAMLLPIMSISL